MRAKELSVELWDRTVSKHRSGEGNKTISAALKVPKNTVASVILKWKKFGTTKTLPREREKEREVRDGTGCLVKLSNRGERPWSGSWLTLTELQSSSVEMGEPSRKTTISAALHQSGLYGTVARRKSLLSKKHMTVRLEFAKRHLKDSQTMRNKILWSFGLNASVTSGGN